MNDKFIIILLIIAGLTIYWYHLSALPKSYFKERKWYLLIYDTFLELLAIFCIITAIKLM